MGLVLEMSVSFNLDEYFPMTKKDINSYHHFMNVHLFDHVDIVKKIFIFQMEILKKKE